VHLPKISKAKLPKGLFSLYFLVRVREKINSQILGFEASILQGVQSLEYQNISAVGQRKWTGSIGV
jgi:hypothetical protein